MVGIECFATFAIEIVRGYRPNAVELLGARERELRSVERHQGGDDVLLPRLDVGGRPREHRCCVSGPGEVEGPLAAAFTAGLITKESTHRPAEGMGSAAFRHGPMEMLDVDVFLLVFAGDATTRALNEALVADARAAGARAYLAAGDAREPPFRLPVVPDVARPLVELLPVEMITLALAALDGREAGRFERAAKVTATE